MKRIDANLLNDGSREIQRKIKCLSWIAARPFLVLCDHYDARQLQYLLRVYLHFFMFSPSLLFLSFFFVLYSHFLGNVGATLRTMFVGLFITILLFSSIVKYFSPYAISFLTTDLVSSSYICPNRFFPHCALIIFLRFNINHKFRDSHSQRHVRERINVGNFNFSLQMFKE